LRSTTIKYQKIERKYRGRERNAIDILFERIKFDLSMFESDLDKYRTNTCTASNFRSSQKFKASISWM